MMPASRVRSEWAELLIERLKLPAVLLTVILAARQYGRNRVSERLKHPALGRIAHRRARSECPESRSSD